MDWVTCEVDIPQFAGVVDFVFSNLDKTIWDNFDGNDYHTEVQGRLTSSDLAQLISHSVGDVATGRVRGKIPHTDAIVSYSDCRAIDFWLFYLPNLPECDEGT